MALIKCAECGREISDKAKKCPNCSHSIKKKSEKRKDTNSKRNLKKIIVVVAIIVLVLLVIVVVYLFLHNSKKNYSKNENSKTNYIGKWEHNINWQIAGQTIRESYASIELFEDGTFEYKGYNLNDDDKMNYNGIYDEKDGIISLSGQYDGQPYIDVLFIKDGKLCFNSENCEDYYVKSNSTLNNHLVIEDGVYITYEDYQNLLSNKEMAVVVVVSDNSKYCREYRKTVNSVSVNYSIPFYYYKMSSLEEDKINIEGTPTTLLIQNGNIVDTIVGQKEYEYLAQKVNSLINGSIQKEKLINYLKEKERANCDDSKCTYTFIVSGINDTTYYTIDFVNKKFIQEHPKTNSYIEYNYESNTGYAKDIFNSVWTVTTTVDVTFNDEEGSYTWNCNSNLSGYCDSAGSIFGETIDSLRTTFLGYCNNVGISPSDI